jgi:hypothetical protein
MTEEGMHDRLKQLRETINLSFDLLDLIVIRLALLALAAIGVYTILQRH